ncbi:hypothetical protein D3C85_1481090 [compost metagenome]
MNDADHLAQIFRRGVVLRINPELFTRIGRNVPAWEVLLLSPNRQQQAARLGGIALLGVRLDRAQYVLAHGQLRAISDTAGNPPWGSSLFSPKRNLQDLSPPLHSSLLGSSVGLSSSSNMAPPV